MPPVALRIRGALLLVTSFCTLIAAFDALILPVWLPASPEPGVTPI